jgi:hypothetical protein
VRGACCDLRGATCSVRRNAHEVYATPRNSVMRPVLPKTAHRCVIVFSRGTACRARRKNLARSRERVRTKAKVGRIAVSLRRTGKSACATGRQDALSTAGLRPAFFEFCFCREVQRQRRRPEASGTRGLEQRQRAGRMPALQKNVCYLQSSANWSWRKLVRSL